MDRFWDHFFFIYTADIGSIIAAHGLLPCYHADKTQLYFCCRPSECVTLKGKALSSIDDQQAGYQPIKIGNVLVRHTATASKHKQIELYVC